MGDIYFRAGKPNMHRLLSNLFGHVEWAYQRAKYADGSVLAAYLDAGAVSTMTVDAFAQDFALLHPRGRAKTYTDGTIVASGVLAKFTSAIAHGSTVGKKRLEAITGQTFTPAQFRTWRQANVLPERSDAEKDSLLLALMHQKFAVEPYRTLLLSTHDRVLHEANARALNVDRYTFLSENAWVTARATYGEAAARGGDRTGQLLMQVRDALAKVARTPP
jgi:predicted NAD-dependent protein-ADP-ribosyltransferase YbiA (DUF1768 family)